MSLNKHKSKESFVQDLKNIYLSLGNNTTDKVLYLQYVCTYLANNVTEYVSDNFFELELNKISEIINHDLNSHYKKNSILHIMTEAHSSGGHTKLLENILKNTRHIYSEQSVLITHHSSDKPSRLTEIVKETGSLTVMNKDTIINKVQFLSNLASQYEYIMLHIHPEDILANLAFGNTFFKRPVILVNHADHRFGLGVSISDVVLELSNEGKNFSMQHRGTCKSEVIYIPTQNKNVTLTKEDARKYLKIKKDKKIILSIASEFKYGKDKKDIENFSNMALNIVQSVPDSEFILIGPSIDNKYWKEVYITSQGKVNLLGSKPMEMLQYYIMASDVYIESFPFGSYTAFLDVAIYNINMISLKKQTFTLDLVINNDLLVNNISEIEEKAIKMLNSKDEIINNYDLSMHLPELWTSNFVKIINDIPKNHKVYNFESKKISKEYYLYLESIMKDNLGLRKIYQQLPYKIKFKVLNVIINNNKINTWKDYYKLFYKTLL